MKSKMPVFLCVVLWLAAGIAWGVQNYNIILPSYPPGGVLVRPAGLNDLNQVVGPVSMNPAYLWQNGERTLLPLVSGDGVQINAINNAGRIVGIDSWSGPGFILNGTIRTAISTGYYTLPYALNESDQVVGSAHTTTGNTMYPFLWQNGSLISLGTLGGTYGRAYDINEQGVVVGFSQNASGDTRAFIYRNNAMTDLGTLGGSQSNAVSVNDANEVVGWSEIANGYQHAFIWENGAMTDLGTLGGSQSQAFSINNSGQILGWAETSTGYRPLVIWENGTAIRLNSLIPPDSGWELVLTEPLNMDENPFYRINHHGVILGTGYINGGGNSFLMIPRSNPFFLHDGNQDGVVNLLDFAEMSGEWLK